MDSVEQAEAYACMDFSEPHDAFVSHFAKCFPGFSKGDVLDLGCGTADVTIRFARAFPAAAITGIDGAQAMLDIGSRDVESRGLAGRISLRKCLMPDPGIAGKQYDAVISNSLLHHLSDPMIIWQAVKHCAKKGAPVFVMDLFRPVNTEKAGELVQKHAGDAPPVLKKDFYNSLLSAYNKDEIIGQLRTAGMDFLSVETISDRHIIVWGQNIG
ncbi:MAG: class I SAM-dependent methyltransferase [Nitrospirota bacterium]|nr:class I SAM-dependent methyltransferase [Nitrospirota bacterium]